MGEVIFYTTHCPKCAVLEAKLKKKNIAYKVVDNADEMIALGMKSAPNLGVDGKILNFKEAIDWVNNWED